MRNSSVLKYGKKYDGTVFTIVGGNCPIHSESSNWQEVRDVGSIPTAGTYASDVD